STRHRYPQEAAGQAQEARRQEIGTESAAGRRRGQAQEARQESGTGSPASRRGHQGREPEEGQSGQSQQARNALQAQRQKARKHQYETEDAKIARARTAVMAGGSHWGFACRMPT